MEDQIIVCPHCGEEIPLTETLSAQIKERLRKEFESEIKGKALELSKREEDVDKKLQELADSRKNINKIISEKLELEKDIIYKEAQDKAKEDLEAQLKDTSAEIAEKKKMLEKAQETELELRKKTRELEEKHGNIDLEIARKVDEEKTQIKQEALERFSEEHRLKDLEKEKKIENMRSTIEELKRKSEQGSMQIQGEVLELELESLLKEKFPIDEIVPVSQGLRGADILQKVHNRNGQYCGTIIWETKSTKAWGGGWIEKFKEDQREASADLAVIVSKAMPSGVKNFERLEGVWVTNIQLAVSLAEALRTMLIELSQTKLSTVGKNEKMEVLYSYLSGSEFKQKIEGIVEAFTAMKEDLDKEKRVTMKHWAKREKQIEKVISNTVRMYGDMQGIIGASLPEIETLELEAGEKTKDSF